MNKAAPKPTAKPPGIPPGLIGCGILTLIMLITASAAASDQVTKPFTAYAWSGRVGQYPHIVRMHWLVGKSPDAALAKAATDEMPEGHRVLFSWDVHRWCHDNTNDFCRDAEGKLTSHRGIWWDNGVADIANRFEAFFKSYRQIGGKVDALILDSEVGLSNWSIARDEARWRAIMADSRFESIVAKLGFRDLLTVMNWQGMHGDARNHYKKWNIVMQERVADYYNQAVFAPARRHFPKVSMAEWAMCYHKPEFACPDFNGHDYSAFGNGTHVGTHQSGSLYCEIGQLARYTLAGGNRPYGTNAFSAFRYSVNRMRSMQLSSDVPIWPWVSHKRYKDNRVRDTDLYQELVFHTGLTGPDAFLFWNPRMNGPNQNPDHYTNDEQDKLLNDCLAQLTQFAGTPNRTTLVTNLAGWYDDFILTGMRTGARTVWRFTPSLENGETLSSFLVQSNPPTFQTRENRVKFAKGSIETPMPEVSNQGFWIVSSVNESPIIEKVRRTP